MLRPFTASLFLFLFLFLIPSSTSEAETNPNPNPPSSQAHLELTNHGFPVGLLPASVRNYALNRSTGAFEVDLGGACKITLPPDNYLATYSRRVTGKIVEGRIAELEGIRVWAMFRWWSITGIRSSGDHLTFEVGVVTAKYASKNFDEVPACEGGAGASASS